MRKLCDSPNVMLCVAFVLVVGLRFAPRIAESYWGFCIMMVGMGALVRFLHLLWEGK